jgi:hypothetical protein
MCGQDSNYRWLISVCVSQSPVSDSYWIDDNLVRVCASKNFKGGK